MGFSVGLNWVSIPVAYCNETDCDFVGTLGLSEIEARREADDHYNWHVADWERQNEEWEANGTSIETQADAGTQG